MKNRSYKPILRVYKMGKLARKPLLFIIGHTYHNGSHHLPS